MAINNGAEIPDPNRQNGAHLKPIPPEGVKIELRIDNPRCMKDDENCLIKLNDIFVNQVLNKQAGHSGNDIKIADAEIENPSDSTTG